MSGKISQAETLAAMTPARRKKILEKINMDDLLNDWNFWARPQQKYPDGDWDNWLVCAGRGYGKTRIGAEAVRMWAQDPTARIALIGATVADTRDVMVEGESGILAVCPDAERPIYHKSKGVLEFPSGAQAKMYSAEKAARLRGPQHTKLWADELAAWAHVETWDMALMGLRLGDNPQAVITTTPRPIKIIKELLKDERTKVTTGSTYDNKKNLAKKFIATIEKKYEGTRLGEQELHAKILDDVQGALWNSEMIFASRVSPESIPEFVRVAVAVDPAVTASATSDETGIIGGGLGADGHVYVMHDASCRISPRQWGERAANLYHHTSADLIVAEVNQGGDLVEEIIKGVDKSISYKSIHAKRGKFLRAQPVAALYEQGKVHHVYTPNQSGESPLDILEEQMKTYDPTNFKSSPDRLDALVYLVTELSLNEETSASIRRL